MQGWHLRVSQQAASGMEGAQCTYLDPPKPTVCFCGTKFWCTAGADPKLLTVVVVAVELALLLGIPVMFLLERSTLGDIDST